MNVKLTILFEEEDGAVNPELYRGAESETFSDRKGRDEKEKQNRRQTEDRAMTLTKKWEIH